MSSFVVVNDVILFVVCNVLAFFLCAGVPIGYFISAFPPFAIDISILHVTQ